MAATGEPRRIAFVVGTTVGGIGAHLRMISAGCAARGEKVMVLAPAAADSAYGFAALPGVTFAPVEIGSRPRPGDAVAVLRLRRAFRAADVVHAHGLRAGALSVLARTGASGGPRPGLVVTVHNAPPVGGAAAAVYRVLERLVARGADLVLCVSGDLERRMAAAGARSVGRALVPAADQAHPVAGLAGPVAGPVADTGRAAAATGPSAMPASVIAARAAGRPVVLAAGRLAPQKGLETLLGAAVSWRDLDPPPLVMIAGDGPLAADLRARAAALGVDAEFLGHRDDVPALLAAATVFVLPSHWEGQPLVLQEALRAGAAIVATRVGGVPDLTGAAALLVQPGDCAGLAAAVRSVLTDPALAARLRATASARAATLPTEADAVAAALAAYATLATHR
jgi:glycosyltransferase involved in cell wall biosynthesis